MNQILSFLLVFIIVFCSTTYIHLNMQKRKQQKIFQCLQNKDLEGLEKELNSKLIPEFNKEFLRLNAYFLLQKTDKIESQIEKIYHIKKTPQQNKEFIVKIYEYYVQLQNKEKSSQLLEEIKTYENPALTEHAQMFYDILIDKKSNHIEELIEKLEIGNPMEKGMKSYLISLQYGYLQNKEKELEYQNKSRYFMENK